MKCNRNIPIFNGCYILGPTGPTGASGPATIAVGSTTTVSSDMGASVTNSGTDQNVILDFKIPAGKDGVPPTLEIGTVITGEPGTDATVIIKQKD